MRKMFETVEIFLRDTYELIYKLIIKTDEILEIFTKNLGSQLQ